MPGKLTDWAKRSATCGCAQARRLAHLKTGEGKIIGSGREVDDLRQALEGRNLIERAKGILMKRASLNEPDAFRRLQKLSSEKNRKMVEIARMIVTAEEAFTESE